MLSAVLLILLSHHFIPAHARITNAEVVNDNRRSIPLSRPFGFTELGDPHLTFEVDDPKVIPLTSEQDIDLKCFQFYLVHTSFEVLETVTEGGDCKPEQANPEAVIPIPASFADKAFKDLLEGKKSEHGRGVYNMANKLQLGGTHTLNFVNCCNDLAAVSFKIRTEMFNTVGGRKSYLSVGEIQLPKMYLAMCILFLCGLVLWSYEMYQNKAHIHNIHYIMTALGFFKVLTLVAQCAMYHYIRITGEPDGWNIAYYFFTFCRGIFFFTVIVLVGTGWSYMTPFLGDKERTVLLVVLPLQVIMDILIIVLDEFTPAQRHWFAWRDLMQVVDILCCCVILFPIAWRIRHLREAATTDGKAQRSMKQLVFFRQFYVTVVVYIYFTRIVVRFLEATMSPSLMWMSDASSEMATLVFYALTAWQFQPKEAGNGEYHRLVPEAELEMEEL